MYWPDTNTGVDVEPARKPVASVVRKFFTEGGSGQPPTVPGGDWFNQITNELLNVLAAAGIDPSKTDDDQLLQAITTIINSGVEVSGVLSTSPEFVDIPAYNNELFNVQMQALLNRLASISGATTMGTASGQSVQTALDEIDADRNRSLLSKIKYRLQLANSPWLQPGPVNIIGDSIPFGYFASYEGSPTMSATNGGMFYHRWVSIFARMLSAEFNTGHYITCNPNIYEYGGDEDIVKRTSVSGAWALKNTGLYTSNLLVGQAICTSAQGDYMEFTIPATFDECWVYYVLQPGGGDLSISQNGGAPLVISCNNSIFKQAVVRLDVVSNPQGYCVIRVLKSDASAGEVGVSAVSPSQGVRENGALEGGGLNIFAAPGRRLQDVSESVIADSCNGASALILALGFNDNALNDNDLDPGRAAFSQRINWIIQYCNFYGTPLIVPDCSWKNTADQFTRSELARAARETGGLYIPLPDMLKNGSFPTEVERLSSGLWKDAAHPSKKGHKWIAETVAKRLGLACNSKNDALRYHDYWISLPLTSTYANILTNIPRNLAAYKVSGNSVHIRTQIKLTSGASFPVSTPINICGTAVNSMFWLVPPVKLNSFYLTKLHDVNEGTGVIQGYAAFAGASAGQGVLRLVRPTGVTLTSFNGASSFEIDRWESYDNL